MEGLIIFKYVIKKLDEVEFFTKKLDEVAMKLTFVNNFVLHLK